MRNLTCIACPTGCSLDVDVSRKGDDICETKNNGAFTVTGNKCPRGETYAMQGRLIK